METVVELIGSGKGSMFRHQGSVDAPDNHPRFGKSLFIVSYSFMHRLPRVSEETGYIDIIRRLGNRLAATHQLNGIPLTFVVRGKLKKPQRRIPRIVGWFN